VIVVSLLCSALATAWCVAARGQLALLAALALLGLASNNLPPLSQAMVADTVPDAERDGVFSVYFAAGAAALRARR
jgi:MFS family permease